MFKFHFIFRFTVTMLCYCMNFILNIETCGNEINQLIINQDDLTALIMKNTTIEEATFVSFFQ